MHTDNHTASITRHVGNHRVVVRIDMDFYEKSEGRRTIGLKPIAKFWRLSISADVFVLKGGRYRIVTAGQCQNELAKLNILESDQILTDIMKVWDRWHLNDMRVATRKQRSLLTEKCMSTTYDHRKECLQSNGLLIDRGYEFGSKWLVEKLPRVVKEELKRIVREAGKKFVVVG